MRTGGDMHTKVRSTVEKTGINKPWFYINSNDDEVGIEKLKSYLFGLVLDGE